MDSLNGLFWVTRCKVMPMVATEKCGEGLRTFKQTRQRLLKIVRFVKPNEFREEIKAAEGKVSDPAATIYIALAQKLRCPIWSNDKHLKEQKGVPVLTTRELIELLS